MKKKSLLFELIIKLLYTVYPKIEIEGWEGLINETVVLVGNHAQIHGPITCQLFFPENIFIWCAGQMMNLKEVPAYAYQDFWSQKKKGIRWFFKIVSYLIAPLSVILFNHARTIPVYRDSRILKTFKISVRTLEEGKSLVIFPEQDKKYNHIIYDFQDRFIDLAKIYHKKTGKELLFVPFYLSPQLKKVVIGSPIRYQSEEQIEEERERIKSYLMKEITKIAEELPHHTVIPYRNIAKKEYPTNRPEEREK